MPLKRTEAIVLRSFEVGEQDKIVIFFSRKKGILHGIAKGARKFNNRFGSSLEPFSYVDVQYYEKEKKDLLTLNSCDLKESFFHLQSNYETACLLAYIAELVENFFPPRHSDEILWRLLYALLQALDEGQHPSWIGAYFEGWLAKLTGILPDFQRCKRCRKKITTEARLSLKRDGVFCPSCGANKTQPVPLIMKEFILFIKNNPPRAEVPPALMAKLKEIRKTLQDILVFHLERVPKTLLYQRNDLKETDEESSVKTGS